MLGHVSRVQPVSRWERARAVLGGDFTPLHVVQIEFTSLLLADGRPMELHTIESPGLNSLVPLKPPSRQARTRREQQRWSAERGQAESQGCDRCPDRARQEYPRHRARTGQKGMAVRLCDVQAAIPSSIRSQPDPVRCGTPVSPQFRLGEDHSELTGSVGFTAVSRQHRACQAAHASGFDEFDAGREG